MTEHVTYEDVPAGWHFWPVSILALLWNAFGCVDFTMTATRNEVYLDPFPQEMLDYWFNMPWWIWAIWVIGVFGGFFGSILMLMKRAAAVQLLAASLIAAMTNMAVGIMAKDAPKVEGMAFMPYLIIAIAFGLLAYAYWQHRRGVLR